MEKAEMMKAVLMRELAANLAALVQIGALNMEKANELLVGAAGGGKAEPKRPIGFRPCEVK